MDPLEKPFFAPVPPDYQPLSGGQEREPQELHDTNSNNTLLLLWLLALLAVAGLCALIAANLN